MENTKTTSRGTYWIYFLISTIGLVLLLMFASNWFWAALPFVFTSLVKAMDVIQQEPIFLLSLSNQAQFSQLGLFGIYTQTKSVCRLFCAKFREERDFTNLQDFVNTSRRSLLRLRISLRPSYKPNRPMYGSISFFTLKKHLSHIFFG